MVVADDDKAWRKTMSMPEYFYFDGNFRKQASPCLQVENIACRPLIDDHAKSPNGRSSLDEAENMGGAQEPHAPA